MVKELIIHLGDRKTGSTSIQAVLAGRAWHSHQHSLIYAANKLNNHSLAVAIRKQNQRPKALKEQMAPVRQLLLEADIDIGVISAEHFEVTSPENLLRSIQYYLPELESRVRLIAYIRPHGEALISRYAERMKQGDYARFNGELDRLHDYFLSGRHLFYAERLKRWSNVFGERFTVRPFQRKLLYGHDVVEDFLYFALGSDDFVVNSRSGELNQSLCVSELALLKLIFDELSASYGTDIPRKTRIQFGKYFGSLLASSSSLGAPRTDKPAVHKKLAEKLVLSYEQDAITIDNEFFSGYGSPMREALLAGLASCIDEPQSYATTSYFSDEWIMQTRLWAKFIGRVMVADHGTFRKATARRIAALVTPN